MPRSGAFPGEGAGSMMWVLHPGFIELGQLHLAQVVAALSV